MRSLGWLGFAALVAASGPARAADEDPHPHTEVDVVPLVGGDSDVGVGGGAVLEVARHEAGYKPNRWSLQVASLTTFKPSRGGLRIPYEDDYALFTIPDLVPRVLRLQVRPSFTEEATQKFYGLGNGSKVAPYPDPDDPRYEYGRIHPTLVARVRLTLARDLYLRVGDSFTWNALDVGKGTRLDAQVGAVPDHAVDFFEQALVYDTRDSEIETRRGVWHQLELRESPGGTAAFPYRYAQVDVQLRAYVTPIPQRLTIAARLVADRQLGDPPFYELARYEDTFALGGANGVRGVPGQRYYGKTKIFGNLEARVFGPDFDLFGKRFALGGAAFFDAGRVWADWIGDRPDLDGTGLGLKYGVGGGLRIRQGQSLVVRLDVAWSPDAAPIGGYFAASEMF
jgi:hypothetical protein